MVLNVDRDPNLTLDSAFSQNLKKSVFSENLRNLRIFSKSEEISKKSQKRSKNQLSEIVKMDILSF